MKLPTLALSIILLIFLFIFCMHCFCIAFTYSKSARILLGVICIFWNCRLIFEELLLAAYSMRLNMPRYERGIGGGSRKPTCDEVHSSSILKASRGECSFDANLEEMNVYICTSSVISCLSLDEWRWHFFPVIWGKRLRFPDWREYSAAELVWGKTKVLTEVMKKTRLEPPQFKLKNPCSSLLSFIEDQERVWCINIKGVATL